MFSTCVFPIWQDLKAHRQEAHGPNKVGTKLPSSSRGDSTLIFVPEKAAVNASSSASPSKLSSVMDTSADEEPRVDADKDYAGMTLRLRQGGDKHVENHVTAMHVFPFLFVFMGGFRRFI